MTSHAFPLALILTSFSLCGTAASQVTTETLRLRPTDPPAIPTNSVFGYSLDIDGDRAIVSDTSRGVYLFEVSSGQQLRKLGPEGVIEDFYGSAVALHGDLAVVGALSFDFGSPNLFQDDTGAAYVYDSNTGELLDLLEIDPPVANDNAGNAVAVNDDYIVVAAYRKTESFTSACCTGAVRVYDAASRQVLYDLTAFDAEALDYFGIDVSLDGDMLLVGASGDDFNQGSAYLFDLSNGALVTKITASDGQAGDQFGESVALSAGRALIGASRALIGGGTANNVRNGAAYIFDLTTGQESAILTPDVNSEGGFGSSVALSGDTAVVGAPYESAPVYASGAAYRFDASSGQRLEKYAPSTIAEYNLFGFDIATNGVDSLVSLTGSLFFGIDGIESAACVFGQPLGSNYCTAVVNSSGAAATLRAQGSRVATANNLTIEATNLPTNSFGFLVVGDGRGFVPGVGGSQGNLCLGGAIGRFQGPGQIQSSGPDGLISVAVDTSQLPRPNGPVAIQSGETWNFQLWSRDVVGGVNTSNFTDGYEITFQ